METSDISPTGGARSDGNPIGGVQADGEAIDGIQADGNTPDLLASDSGVEFARLRRLLSMCRRAVDEYGMIEDGDNIAVGLSGGKDSTALLCALWGLRRFYPKRYTLTGVTVDMGFESAGMGQMDFAPLTAFCNRLGIEHRVVHTQISRVVFVERRESNPCSLCARMRRGVLHDAVKEAGCNKLALGHHFDDAVETFMLNLFREGRVGCFSPVTELSRKRLIMIRPLLYACEKDIRYFVNGNDLPLIQNPCPEDEHTERESMKRLLEDLDRNDKGLKHRIFGAMQRGHVDGF